MNRVPLVLASSLGTTSAIWDPVLPALPLDVLTVELPGSRGEPAPPGPYTLADLGGDVLARLDAEGLERVSYCGLSLGGMVGLWLAAHAPERIDRLVACCCAARLGTPALWRERAATVRAGGTRAVADAVVPRWFTAGFRERAPDVVAATVDTLAGADAEGYAGCCEALATADLTPDLAKVLAPALVVAGADDPVATPDLVADLVHGLQHARLAVLPGASHLASLEAPDEVAALLLDHLT
ncbi:MAG: alpha/beta fold hydrolase [Mycobacteriales bacterium]